MSKVPIWSARNDPRGGPTSVAQREQFLTAWEVCDWAERPSQPEGHSEHVAR